MYYGEIKNYDIANGEGVRVSLFVSGCTLHCKGCFNSETWNFKYGLPFDEEVQHKILEELKPDFIEGLSVLGGEPMEPDNQKDLLPFLQLVRGAFPTKTIWLYSGYVYDKDIAPADGRAHSDATQGILECLDVLVDGQFMEDEHDVALAFRGSKNQRIIDVPQTLASGSIVEYKLLSRTL